MKPEEDLESPSEITKLMMAISQVKQVTPDDLTNEVKQMSKLHEAPEEIFLQVDPEGDGPGEWDTLDGATWCQERINHNDVRYVRADRVMQLEAELETERMRLAACGVVALANTPESAAKARYMLPEYYSGSCEDVAQSVDREMALRDRAEQLEADRENLLQLLESASEVIGRFVSDEGWAQSDMDMPARRPLD